MRLKLLAILLLFAVAIILTSDNADAQSTSPPAAGCWFIGQVHPNNPSISYSCGLPEYGPINQGASSCVGSGTATGNACCATANAFCTGVQYDMARRADLYCCPNPVTPPTTPPPAPTCAHQPGSFASYDGCTSCGYDTYHYYIDCNSSSTFSVTYPNPDCNYLCPIVIPDCNSGIVCGACNLSTSGNYCSNNGIQTCTYTTYSGGGACNQVAAPNQTCNLNYCSAGYTCSNGTCTPSTGTPPGGGTCTSGTCDAPTPACGQTTYGSDGCSSCSKTGPACQNNPTCTWNGVTKNPGDKEWQCGYGVDSCASNACVGVPYICNADGTWSNANSAGECTTACQDCRSGCNNNGTQDNGETGVDCGGGGCPACGVGAKFSCSSNGSCNPDANGTFTTPNCNNSCSCADCKQPADLVCKEFVSTDGGTTWSNPPSNNSVTASPGQRVNFKMEIHNSGNGIPWYGTRNNFDETINNYTNIWQNTDPNQADVFWLIYNRDPAFHGISWNNDYYNSGGEFSPGQTDVTAWSEVLTGNAQTFKNQGYAAVSTVVGGAIYRFPGGCTIANGVKQCCYIESESGGQSCHYFPDGCDTTFGQGCPYNATFQCNSVTVSTGTPTPTAVVNNTCTPVDTADLVTISWMNTFPAVSYVDISTDNFKSWYYKPVAGTASTNASSGFTGSQGPLTLGPGITYQVRLWNGVSHSSIVPFTTPAAACCQGNNIIDIPTDNTTYTTGNSYTIEGWSTFCSGPNSTNRNRVDPYICDQGTWNNCRYIGPTNPKVRQDVVNIATSPIWTCGNLNPNPDGWIFNWTPGSSFVGYKTLRVASINDAGNPPACVVWDTKNINIIAAPGAKYTCNGITCVPNANGAYSSLADCNANTACGSGGPNTPWIQTTGGDVHSNTGINTPGGP